MLHAGTVVAAGTGSASRSRRARSTQVGRISALLDAVDPLQTPLTRELDRLGRTVTAAIGVAAVLIGIVAVVRGFPLADAALAGISLAVAAVPEGLPGRGHHRAGDRRAADGAPAGDHPPPARGRDARLDHGRGVGQDRHADAQPDDGAGGVDAARRRRAARAAAGGRALQRRLAAGAATGDGGRPDRDGAARVRRRARDRRRRGAAPRTRASTPSRSTPTAS